MIFEIDKDFASKLGSSVLIKKISIKSRLQDLQTESAHAKIKILKRKIPGSFSETCSYHSVQLTFWRLHSKPIVFSLEEEHTGLKHFISVTFYSL